MAFWKKSEDPWDRKPQEARHAVWSETEPEMAAPESEKASAAPEAPQREAEAETCPWCGGEMKRSYLMGDRGVYWSESMPAGNGWFWDAEELSDRDLSFWDPIYKTVWHCPTCRKGVFTLPEAENPDGLLTARECQEEFRKYARQGQAQDGET